MEVEKFCEHVPLSRILSYEKPHLDLTWMKVQLLKEPLLDNKDTSCEESLLEEKIEKLLVDKVNTGNYQALFLLGQFYFEQGNYDKAEHYFLISISRRIDWQALYQLALMYYDGLGCECDPKQGFDYMYRVATSIAGLAQHLVRPAQFNVGLAYYNGIGVKQSVLEAERFWLMAADEGRSRGVVRAQSALGLLYSAGELMDLKKAFLLAFRSM